MCSISHFENIWFSRLRNIFMYSPSDNFAYVRLYTGTHRTKKSLTIWCVFLVEIV